MILILEKPETSAWVSSMSQSGLLLGGLKGERGKVEANQTSAEDKERRTKIGLGFRISMGIVPMLS